MSTKTKTTSTNQYDQQSMDQYHQNHSASTNVFSDYMKDPLKASYFQNQVNLLNHAANQIGQRNVSNLMNNQNLTGGGVMPGYMQSMLARTGRDTGTMQAQNYLQALMQAEGNRRSAATMAFQDRPLQTGQTSESQRSGLGTWLPQIAGGAIGGFAAGMTGTQGEMNASVSSETMPGTGGVAPWGGSGTSAPGSLPSYFSNSWQNQQAPFLNSSSGSGLWSGFDPMSNVSYSGMAPVAQGSYWPGGYNPEMQY